ncbi:hypothetical protein [Clostridium sp. HMP27]|uniref:hypothetical protein n=1 Tax=Clostridium sp. HMP27 TaxID=1487921 RepID=UPI000A654427|nr:hypothetical protein [Clostridium sp. HMP27]
MGLLKKIGGEEYAKLVECKDKGGHALKEVTLILVIFFSLALMMYLGSIVGKNIYLLKRIIIIESKISLLLIICMWIYYSFATGMWISRDNYLFKFLILILVYNIFVFLLGLNNDRKILKLGYIDIPTSRGYGRFGNSDGRQCIGFIYVLCLVAIAAITVTSGAYLIYGD